MKQTAGKEQRSGFAPLGKHFRRGVLLGGAMVLGGIAVGVLVGGTTSATMVGLGSCLVAYGAWGMRIGTAAQVLSSSFNLLHAGKHKEAGALLDTLEGNTSRLVMRSRNLQRAMIALRRGDLDEAERRATLVISEPPPLLLRAGYEVERGGAYGLRAWVRVAKGDMEGAMSDARAARESPAPVSEALAHASLAEAMVLERRGDRTGLAALLRRDRRLLLGSLGMRERAVVRAMQRFLKTSPTSVYRAPPSRKGTLTEDEPTLTEWIERVAPQLSPYALPSDASTEHRQPPRSDIMPKAERPDWKAALTRDLLPTVEGLGKGTGRTWNAPTRSSLKMLATWVLLIMAYLAIWQFLAPDQTAAKPRRPPAAVQPTSALDPENLLVGAALVAIAVGVFAWKSRGSQAVTRRLQRLEAAVASGENVDAELAELATSKQQLTAAHAEFFRAIVAERRAAFTLGLTHVDAARAKLSTDTLQIVAASMLSPALAGARARLLAAMCRFDEASAELSSIPPDYVLFDRTRFEVTLIALLADGDVDSAGRLVEATPPELSIGPREELLRDLVRAATAPGRVGASELARLRDELREDHESRAWIERVARVLLTRFDQATRGDDESNAVTSEGSIPTKTPAAPTPLC